ncbi:MAG: NAD(P)/FAD-dependent oxidoreductase [Nitrospiraceae bacterium]
MKLYVIIGGGPAGINAAAAIRARDGEGEILVLDRDRDHPYYRTELDTYIGGSTSDAELPLHPPAYYREQRITLRLQSVVARLEPSDRRVELAGGERVEYDALLLAPGSYPLTVSCPGSQLTGVMTVRTWDDARCLTREVLETDRPIVVVGGGVLGLILAEGILQRGRQVVLLEREPRLWAPVLDEVASDLIRRGLTQAGIEVLLGEEIVEVHGQSGRVAGVRTSGGRRMDAAFVVIAIGVRPDIGFLDGSGVRTDRGILIDHEFRTNVPEVFAAGDAAQAYDPISGQFRVVTNWNNAVEQGKLAGGIMAGSSDVYRGAIVSNSEMFGGVRVSVLGVTLPTSEGTIIMTGCDQAKGIYRKLVLRQDRLIGALLVGNTSGEGMMRKQIVEGKATSVTELKSRFLTGLVIEEFPRG